MRDPQVQTLPQAQGQNRGTGHRLRPSTVRCVRRQRSMAWLHSACTLCVQRAMVLFRANHDQLIYLYSLVWADGLDLPLYLRTRARTNSSILRIRCSTGVRNDAIYENLLRQPPIAWPDRERALDAPGDGDPVLDVDGQTSQGRLF